MASQAFVIIGSGKGFLADSTKMLPDTVIAFLHQLDNQKQFDEIS